MINRNKVNNFWIFLIKILSYFTIIILALILGYLIYKGLYSTKQTTRPVLNTINSELPFALYASKTSHINELDWFTLQQIATGKIKNLRTLTKVNKQIEIYVDKSEITEFSSYLNLNEEELTKYCTSYNDINEILSSNNNTTKLLITKKDIKQPSAFVSVNISDDVLVVNSDVTKTSNNKRISKITNSQLEQLKNNEINNYYLLNGPNLETIETGIDKVGVTSGAFCFTSAKLYDEKIKANEENIALIKVVHVVRGRNLTLEYIFTKAEESGKFGGIITIIANTIFLVILTIIISAPLGIGSAIFLVEYAKKGKLTYLIRTGIDLLAGVPSIIFGLFGLIAFVNFMNLSFSLLSGSLTVSLMVLPTIIKTSEEALKAVSQELRSGSQSLGATKIETIFKVVLPSASKGILSGIILAIGRTVGETAALIFTLGSSTDLATNLNSSARSLSMHIYLIITEGLPLDDAFSSALLLIILVLAINIFTRKILEKGQNKNG